MRYKWLALSLTKNALWGTTVAVQLPGYGPPGNVDIVFYMRLAQADLAGVENAAVVATYDDSCAAGKTTGCPHGTTHTFDPTCQSFESILGNSSPWCWQPPIAFTL